LRQKLDTQAGGLREEPEPFDLRYSGPKDLPFDHDDVRVYIDNLFTDGLLLPTSSISRSLLRGTWMAIGVAASEAADDISRFRKLLQLMDSDRPSPDSDHQAWRQAAARWAEIVAVRWSLPAEIETEDKERFSTAHQLFEKNFYEWMILHYASLHSARKLQNT
jgi:hypothetical protein